MKRIPTTLLILVLSVAISVGCKSSQRRIAAPVLPGDIDSLVQLLGTLHYGDQKAAPLRSNKWVGYTFSSESGHQIELSVSRQVGGGDVLVALYGPRSEKGDFPPVLVKSVLRVGRHSTQLNTTIPDRGEYLVLIGLVTQQLPQQIVQVKLECANCSQPVCQTLFEQKCSQNLCTSGFETDANGCLRCTCNALSCPPDKVSVAGRCVPSCTCSGALKPVCAAGVTYLNRCEANCRGVFTFVEGACPKDCAEVTCDKGCDFGFKSDSRGCQTCECNLPTCENCSTSPLLICGADGVTHLNNCRLLCAGTTPLYAGHCQVPSCPPNNPQCDCPGPNLKCDLSCGLGIVVDANGCHRCECQKPCREDAECLELKPVCGVRIVNNKVDDVRTFTNRCLAECAGFVSIWEGTCPRVCSSDDDCPRLPGGQKVSCQKKLPQVGQGISSPFGICIVPKELLSCASSTGKPDATSCPSGFDCKPAGGSWECRAKCACTRIFAPVCGTDGRTYLNACTSLCAGSPIDHPGVCCKPLDATAPTCPNGYMLGFNGCPISLCAPKPADCSVCTDLKVQVCGGDGKLYQNRCQAHCHGTNGSLSFNATPDQSCTIGASDPNGKGTVP